VNVFALSIGQAFATFLHVEALRTIQGYWSQPTNGGSQRGSAVTHKPIVIERTDWRITKAACSCGEPLRLGLDSYSFKKQGEKLVDAFQKHKIERLTERKKAVQSAAAALDRVVLGL
jgi:hypothetical protein